MDTEPFQVYPAQRDFARPVVDNVKRNIIAGPQPHTYWNHSPGIRKPMEREEGPLPILGNIGELVRQEANDQYKSCDSNPKDLISGSPNCTTAFDPDYYTPTNTCGAECVLKAPESFGDKNFGLDTNYSQTSIHSIHAYENKRAGAAGQISAKPYGCYEWIPKQSEQGDQCILEQPGAYQTVGDWSSLPQFSNISRV